MTDTLHTIIKLELKRHELYKLAAHGKLSQEQRESIPEITNQLQLLWDQHRREDATRRWGSRSMTNRKNNTTAA